jgi:transcriptional regulator with XRE-family HTH domain
MKRVLTKEQGLTNIAENLKRIMQDRRLSQSELARKSGIAVMQINRMVRGISLPNVVDLSRVAEALDVSLDRLVSPPRHASVPQPISA